VRDVWSAGDPASVTARALAARRASAEGQEGLRAFLEKRKPLWVK
jgi:methylglutaconyl-CoA hydratase